MELDYILNTLEADLFYIFIQPIKEQEIIIMAFRNEDRFSDELEKQILDFNKHNLYDSLKAGFFHMNGIFEEFHEIN